MLLNLKKKILENVGDSFLIKFYGTSPENCLWKWLLPTQIFHLLIAALVFKSGINLLITKF